MTTARPARPAGSRRGLTVLMVAALLLPVAARLRHEHAPDRLTPGAPVEALLVGDSVMAGMAQTYGAASRQLLAARHSFILDAKGCRRLITTSCQIGSTPRPPNAITTVRSYPGAYNRALVMAAGYNDSTTGSTGVSAAVDVMMAEAAKQGVPYVVWLTYREAGSSSNRARFHAHNVALVQKRAQYPNLILADWATRSAGLPSSWFSADGIHLGTEATKAMADLIADVLDMLPPPTPPTTTTTTIPCRITDTTIAVTTLPPPATSVDVLVSAADVPEQATRLQSWCPPTTTAASG